MISFVSKFRGDDEDWLNFEGRHNKGPKGRKSKKKTGLILLPSKEKNAVVTAIHPDGCTVQTQTDNSLLCTYRRTLINQLKAEKGSDDEIGSERTPVAVGDYVVIKGIDEKTGVVEALCRRKNQLTRPAPGRPGQFHVIAANLDLVVIVASAKDPVFSEGLVDRYLVACESAQIQAVLCVTKADLIDDNEKPWELYRSLGVDVFLVTKSKPESFDSLKKLVTGKRTAFCGHSGVGKTSALRILTDNHIGKVGDVSDRSQKGMHTTTRAQMIQGPNNTQWIDTPGVREFGLSGMTAERVKKYFPEFKNAQCESPNCLHLDENGCDIREKGFSRYTSYRRIVFSLLEPQD